MRLNKRHNIKECPNECCGHHTVMNVDEFRCVNCVNTIWNIKAKLQNLIDTI